MTPRQPASATAHSILGGRYDVMERVGAGTAANVFRVRDRRSGIVRAAKVLKSENAGVPAILTRFEDEYRILRTLHHPHLPEVYDYGWTEDGGRCLVMEFVDGEPLDAYFRARPRELWVILYQLCEVLTFIHNHNLLHQDIKPANILVRRTTAFGDEIPLVKLIDFGLTCRRDVGERAQMVGTPEYMAPEVVRGAAPFTRAVDYYSLGIVLYELLCGKPPFQGSVAEVLRAHLDRTPEIEEEDLEWTELYPYVRGLLAKDTRVRLETFEELRHAVVTRLTGGIGALDAAYGAARIESMGMIGKAAELPEFLDTTLPSSGDRAVLAVSLDSQPMSGRSHFLEAARAEWRIRGVVSWQLGEESDAAWLLNRPADAAALATEKDFERAWTRVERAARGAPVWIVACGELTTEESRLYEYFETGRTLAGPMVRRNLGFVTATTGARPAPGDDGALRLTLPTLSSGDVGAVVERFRGELFRTGDAQVIAGLLKDARVSGEIIMMLRRLIAKGGLLFEAQRWRMVAEKARAIAREPASTGTNLVLPLSPAQKRVMVCLACHPGPVPVRWFRRITGLDDGATASGLHDLRLRHLLEPVDIDGTPAVRTTSRTVERAVLRDEAPATIAEIHRAYAECLTERVAAAPSAEDLRTLALHQEGSRDDRAAYRTRRQLFRELWKRRAYGEVEQICREAMAAESLRFGLARAYLRELVNVLWAQNLTARAYHDMKGFSERYGEVPKGLLPKYARGLMDALGPKEGLAFIEGALKGAPKVSRALVARLQVEHVLALYNMSKHHRGLKAAKRTEEMTLLLSENDKCRLLIYRTLLQFGLGLVDMGVRGLSEALLIAETHQFGDELVLIQILKGNQEINHGRPDQALRSFARAIRSASRKRLILRHYQLLANAASAYSELGDNARAIRCREKAVWLAQYLGQKGLLAASWWRVAHYSERNGKFGNAIRYFDRAIMPLDEYSRPADKMYAHVLRHDLHTFLGGERSRVLAKDARKALHLTSDIGEQGTLESYGAAWLFRSRRYRDAFRAYSAARQKCMKAGRKDEAMRAAVGEARALLFMGRPAACKRVLIAADLAFDGFTSVDVNCQRRLTELFYQYRTRGGRKELAQALVKCEELVDVAHMSTRLEVYGAVLRGYARLGMSCDVLRVRSRYEEIVRGIVANMESPDLSRQLLIAIRYADVMGECGVFERKSARVSSVDAGTVSGSRSQP